MSSPRPHSSKRLGRGILFLWVTAVIEAQAMEDLGMLLIIGWNIIVQGAWGLSVSDVRKNEGFLTLPLFAFCTSIFWDSPHLFPVRTS